MADRRIKNHVNPPVVVCNRCFADKTTKPKEIFRGIGSGEGIANTATNSFAILKGTA